MANVLICEDNASLAAQRHAKLSSRGHNPRCAVGANVDALYAAVAKELPTLDWCVLMLDMQGQTFIDGIKVYNRLCQNGFRNMWSHTLIVSRHAAANVKQLDLKNSIEAILFTFIDTADIPHENVFPYTALDRIVARIEQLCP